MTNDECVVVVRSIVIPLQGRTAMTHRYLFSVVFFTVAATIVLASPQAPPAAEDGKQSDFPKSATATSEEARAGSPDATKYELRYKLATGDVLRFEASHRASIRSTIDKTTQEAQTRTDSVKLWKVTDVLPNGDIEVMNVIESLHMKNQLPDHDPTEYDSQRDKAPPPGYEDAARAIGVPLSVVRMTPAGKVVRRDVKVRQQSVEDDTQLAVRLPDKPVAIGDSWDEPFEPKVMLEKGGTKLIQTRRHHALKAVEDGIATIEVTYQVLSPIDAHIECQLVQRLMEGEVKFDIADGRVLSQQMEIDKRILGFAGPTSSMHYVMRMEEKLTESKPNVAAQEVKTSTPKTSAPNPAPPKATTNADPLRANRSDRSSSRPRTTRGTKNRR
jgi:hypothetical protein